MSFSSGTMTIGVVAIFSGLLGAYGLRALLLPDPPAPPPAPPQMTVPLAAADLPAGRQVVLGDIALHRMSVKQMTEQGLADSEVMLSPEQIIGRILEKPVLRNKPFKTTGMYLDGRRPDITTNIQPGYRAVTLEIPEVRGGMTGPGNFVDVLFRSEAQPGRADSRVQIPEATVTLFEGVEVLALAVPQSTSLRRNNNLDIRLSNGREDVKQNPPRVTLAVTLRQANILRTVEGRGEITLIPRGVSETTTTANDLAAAASNGALLSPAAFPPSLPKDNPSPAMTLEGLLGVEPPEPPFATEIYRRGSREVQVFDTSVSPVTPAAFGSRSSR